MPYPCPKCKQSLEPSGEVAFAGRCLPVYECPQCTHTVDLFGVQTEVQVAFCVDEAGRLFDPAAPDEPFPTPSGN